MNIKLLDIKELKDSLASSAIEFADDQIYLVRNDQGEITILDKNWKIKETFSISADSSEMQEEETLETVEQEQDESLMQAQPQAAELASYEIVAQVQPGKYEASAIIVQEEIPYLLQLGNGSDDALNKGFLFNLLTRTQEPLDLTVFYKRIKETGLEDLKIQGVTVLHDKLILSTNGSELHPGNHFIITTLDFWKNQEDAELLTERIEWEDNPGRTMTIYGLTYSYKNDWLIVSVVPEGIDKSGEEASFDNYIVVMENALRKTIRKKIKLNNPVNLSKNNKSFKGVTMKYHCLQSEKDGRVKMLLLGESEKGKNFLFKIRIKED
jgi:hypothetical protein